MDIAPGQVAVTVPPDEDGILRTPFCRLGKGHSGPHQQHPYAWMAEPHPIQSNVEPRRNSQQDQAMTKINDAIEQNKKLILAQETVAERYPDATLSGFPGDQNAWASPGVLSDADKFLVLVRAEVMATIGTTVEGVTVLFPGYFNIQALLDKMQRNQPEVYEAFVKAVAQELQSK